MSGRGWLERWLYDLGPGFSGILCHFGTRVVFPKNPRIFPRASETGTYEQDTLKPIAVPVRQGTPYLGMCANIGLNSNPLVQCVPIGRVASFDPPECAAIPSGNTVPQRFRRPRAGGRKGRRKPAGGTRLTLICLKNEMITGFFRIS